MPYLSAIGDGPAPSTGKRDKPGGPTRKGSGKAKMLGRKTAAGTRRIPGHGDQPAPHAAHRARPHPRMGSYSGAAGRAGAIAEAYGARQRSSVAMISRGGVDRSSAFRKRGGSTQATATSGVSDSGVGRVDPLDVNATAMGGSPGARV